MQCVMEIAGLPPSDLLRKASRTDNFFEADGTPRLTPTKAGLRRYPGSKELSQAIGCSDTQFVSFLQVTSLYFLLHVFHVHMLLCSWSLHILACAWYMSMHMHKQYVSRSISVAD